MRVHKLLHFFHKWENSVCLQAVSELKITSSLEIFKAIVFHIYPLAKAEDRIAFSLYASGHITAYLFKTRQTSRQKEN